MKKYADTKYTCIHCHGRHEMLTGCPNDPDREIPYDGEEKDCISELLERLKMYEENK